MLDTSEPALPFLQRAINGRIAFTTAKLDSAHPQVCCDEATAPPHLLTSQEHEAVASDINNHYWAWAKGVAM